LHLVGRHLRLDIDCVFLSLTHELLPNFILQLSTKDQFQVWWWVRNGVEVVRAEVLKYSETPWKIKILLMKKLWAGLSQGMFDVIRCRIFCLPVGYPQY